MAVSVQILSNTGAVLGQSVLKNKATLKVQAGERYRFVDENGQLPKGLKTVQIGKDVRVEWQDADSMSGGTSSLTLENFATMPDVAISAPGLSSGSVQGLSYAPDSGMVTNATAPSSPAYAAPASGNDGIVTAAWLLGGGLAVAAVASGHKSGVSTPAPAPAADTVPPGAPSINGIAISNQNPSTLSGTAEPGSSVQVTVGGAVYTVTTATNGVWTLNTSTSAHTGTFAPNPNATTSVTAIATDAAGNHSFPASGSFTVDTLAPTVHIIGGTTGVVNIATGAISYTFTLSEASTDFSELDVIVSGGQLTAGSFTQTGLTTYTATAAPTLGNNAANMGVSVSAGALHDAAGNANAQASHTQAYDTQAPVAPTLDALPLSNNVAPTLSGTAEAGSSVQISVGGAVFTVQATAGNTWTLNTATAVHTGTFAPNTQGSSAVSLLSTDAAGNATAGNAASISIDAVGPTITAIAITSFQPDNNYSFGDTIEFTITFNEPFTIDSGNGFYVFNPIFSFNMGSQAVMTEVQGTSVLANSVVFLYQVQHGDLDVNGVSWDANPLVGHFLDAMGNVSLLNFAASTDNPSHTVGSEVHTIIGTVGSDDAATVWGIPLYGGAAAPSAGHAAAIGEGATAQTSGGNRLWHGEDSVSAGNGNDLITVYASDAGGNDTLDGGAGRDTISYDSLTNGVTVDMQNATYGGGTAILAGGGLETLTGIETFYLSQGADSFVGSNSNAPGEGDAVYDRGGRDNINLGAGNDTVFDFDNVTDTLNGGAGIDWLIYSGDGSNAFVPSRGGNMVVNFALGTANAGGGSGTDIISGIECVQTGTGDDTIFGRASGNVIYTGNGADLIYTQAGADSVDAGAGNDTVFDGDQTADNLNGGSGTDLINYSVDTPQVGIAFVPTAITVSLQTGLTSRGDIVRNFENVIGTGLSDSIVGSENAGTAQDNNSLDGADGDDYLSGLGGDDTLLGGNGEDTLVGGSGINRLDGGADSDLADYSTSAVSVSVSLGANNQVSTGVSSTGDVLLNIENLLGSSLNDTLQGDLNANNIYGGAGADSLCGGLGVDVVEAGDGADTVFSTAGNLSGGSDAGNYYSGGDDANIDLLDMSLRTDNLIFSATGTGATANAGDHTGSFYSDPSLLPHGAFAIADSYEGFERIIMGAGNDLFTTDDGTSNSASPAIWVNGGAGNDIIFGGLGNDTIFGGDGNDVIASAEGRNTVDGGNGYDTFNSGYAPISYALVSGINLNALNSTTLQFIDGLNSASIAVITNIESFAFTAFSDNINIAGYTQDITIDLGGGYDTVVSGSGNDSLYGIVASDINGGAGNDTIRGSGQGIWHGGTGNDFIYDGSAGVVFAFGNHTDLYGDAGNDTLQGAIGSMAMARYDNVSSGGVTVQLGVSNVGAGSAVGDAAQVGVDTLINIQSATLSNQNDYAVGNELANLFDSGEGGDTLFGMGGDDSLWGGNNLSSGNDYLDGGAGNDEITGGAGADTIYGGLGNDTILAFGGANWIDGGDGLDSIVSASGADTIYGGLGSDNINAGDGNNSVYGDAGNDIITTGAGNDWIDGGDGNDSINSGAGLADTVYGGLGNDSIYVQAASGDKDTVYAGGGNDIIDYAQFFMGAAPQALYGEAGSDVIRISARPFAPDRYDGGAGVDVLQFIGNYSGAAINLSALTNATSSTGVIKGIEVLDFSNTTNAVLVIDTASLLNMSNTDDILVITDNASAGNPADTVTVQTSGMNVPGGWHTYTGGPVPAVTMSDGYQLAHLGGGIYAAPPLPNTWVNATAYSQNFAAGSPLHTYQMFQNGALTQYLLVDQNITSSGHFFFS